MRCSKICALLGRKFSSAAIHSVFDYTEDRTMRDKIKLVSSAGTGHYYTTDKNKTVSYTHLTLPTICSV